jgi:hypothetical protein
MDRRKFLRRTSALGALTLAGCMADDETGGATDDTPTPDSTDDVMPAISDSSIERTGKGCAFHQGDEGTQTPETEYARTSTDDSKLTVSFDGQLITPTPCYLPTIEDTEYDTESDRLTITLGTEKEDDVCVECVGVVEFSGTVKFENGVPSDVVVVHDDVTLTPQDGESPEPTADESTTGESASAETPALRASSFSVTNVSSDSPERSADASFDEEESTVTVTGTIVGNNGCMTADVGSANYDAEDDQLDVNVVTTEREDSGTCTQQLVAIDYEATFSFESAIPTSVSVSHDGQGVMAAGYGSSSASAPEDDDRTPDA